MSDRIEIDANKLDDVVGGALKWGGGNVYPKDDPSAVYHYNNYPACMAYIKEHWPGGAHNEDTLIMLKDAGLVWK